MSTVNEKLVDIKVSSGNSRAFKSFTKLLGWRFENFLFALAENFTEQYNGGMWDAGYFEIAHPTTYFPIPPCDGENFEVCNPNNYYEGTMSPRAYGLAIFMMALSDYSHNDGTTGQNAAKLYHRIRTLVYDSGESSSPESLTVQEVREIAKFLD